MCRLISPLNRSVAAEWLRIYVQSRFMQGDRGVVCCCISTEGREIDFLHLPSFLFNQARFKGEVGGKIFVFAIVFSVGRFGFPVGINYFGGRHKFLFVRKSLLRVYTVIGFTLLN